MNIQLMNMINGVAIVATAVVFGTDMFFALLGKKAISKSKDQSIADVMGYLHEVADARMLVFGIVAIANALGQLVWHGLHAAEGQLAALALIALLVHLTVYFSVSRPVNNMMKAAGKYGGIIADVKQ